ncbi:MAG TPA: NADH-quinone oxidoreductase subunit C [Acidimicrobiia bacterium]|jgi:NADH:ubiquinone oxidoreductase subunit C
MTDAVREQDHEPDAESPSGREPQASGGGDDELAAAICARFAGSVFHESHGQPVVYVDKAVFADVGTMLRDEEQVTMCLDVTAVDHLADNVRHAPGGVQLERFEVVANYLSHARNRRIRVICQVPAGDTTVPSLTPVYHGANFGEREVYDLFGITFDGHPDLTRILMPDEWIGSPLRKDDAPARVPVTFKGDPSPR